MSEKKAIIMGASSGMGKELATILSVNNFIVGLAARRINLLEELQKKLPGKTYIKQIDVTKPEEAGRKFRELIAEMDGVDLIIISSGYGDMNRDLDWKIEKETIDVNVSGFTLIADIAFPYFISKGAGHLVGISSVAALRGLRGSPSYSASKAYISNYLEGLRQRAVRSRKPIYVTDIMPGFVKTAMSKGNNLFWVASAREAAAQIYEAIRKKKNLAYITRRWRLIAWLMKLMPDWLYNKL
ncbi:MAG TPA: SDR family NAD(P)-dependent oxidoreductase [Smithellaceae bacterium]|nr:SDR family NAD(P)-dependent oxidoreductase [Smithellaceae bacterium]